MPKRMTEEDLFDEIAAATSQQFAKLLIWSNALAKRHCGRAGAEDLLAQCVCDNLATLIGMAAVHPLAMVEAMYGRLKAHDFQAVKVRNLGFKLGVVQDAPEVEQPIPSEEDTVNIGPPKE
jgi:hypothetical protein